MLLFTCVISDSLVTLIWCFLTLWASHIFMWTHIEHVYRETLFTQTMVSETVIWLYFDCSVMLNTWVLHRIQKTHQTSESLHMKRQRSKKYYNYCQKNHNKYEHWTWSMILWRHRNEIFFPKVVFHNKERWQC